MNGAAGTSAVVCDTHPKPAAVIRIKGARINCEIEAKIAAAHAQHENASSKHSECEIIKKLQRNFKLQTRLIAWLILVGQSFVCFGIWRRRVAVAGNRRSPPPRYRRYRRARKRRLVQALWKSRL